MRTAKAWIALALMAAAPAVALSQQKAIENKPLVLPNCTISPLHDVRVPVRVAGVLSEILVKEGSVVKKGEVLARLDDRLAENEVAGRELAAKNDAPILEAGARRDEAQHQYEDNLRLAKSNTISKTELRISEARLEIAVYGIKSAEVDKALAEVDLAKAELQRDMHAVKSPIDGVVVQLVRQPGEAVQQLDPILRIIRTDIVKIEGNINLRNADRVRKGMTIDVYPNRTVDEVRLLRGHTGPVRAVKVLPDQKRCVSAGDGGYIFVWNILDGVQEKVLTGHEGSINCLATHPRFPNRVVAGGEDRVIRVHDLQNGKVTASIDTLASPILALALHPRDPDICFTGHEDREIRVWNLKTGQKLNTLSGHTNYVTSLSIAPDAKYLLSAGTDRSARLWDLAANELLRTFPGRTDDVHHINVSPSGDEFLFNSYSFLQVRSIPQGRPAGSFESSQGRFTDVALFLPVPGLVLTAIENNELQLWQQGTKSQYSRLARSYYGHTGPIHSVDFAADGRFFVSGSEDRTVRVWTVPTTEEIDRERRRGVIEFVNDQVNPGSETVKMYAEIENEDGELRPGTFATTIVYPSSEPLASQ